MLDYAIWLYGAGKKSKYRISNHEYRMSKECILSFLKKLSEAKHPYYILRFDIRYSAVLFLQVLRKI